MSLNNKFSPKGSGEHPPLISVVMPVYCHTADHRRYLIEALHSVASQTFRDFEVVIVDDLSPIEVEPVVEAMAMPSQVKILRNPAKIGHAESRNRGVETARGEFIAFLDHDDVWLPEKLERQLAVLQANHDAAMVFCDMEVFGPNRHRLCMNQSIIPERPSFYWFASHGNYVISASSVLVRKQLLLDIGLFDNRYSTSDDFDAWLKILCRAPILHLPKKLAKYRLHYYNVNYSVDFLNDTRLLTMLICRYWQTARPREKFELLPLIGRKLARMMYFILRRYRKP